MVCYKVHGDGISALGTVEIVGEECSKHNYNKSLAVVSIFSTIYIYINPCILTLSSLYIY